MLRKLMKHELRATSRIMLPIFLVVLLTAVGANISSRLLLETDYILLNIFGIILLCAFCIAIIGSCIVAFLIMLQRFYKNLLQDEGYIMMTLPVSVHQLVTSKILISTLWCAGTILTIFLSMLILAFDVEFVKNLAEGCREFFYSLSFNSDVLINGPLFIMELLILFIIAYAGICLKFYSALSIGHSFSNHKMLKSIIIYIVMQFIIQFGMGSFIALVNYNEIDYMLAQTLPVLPVAVSIHVLMIFFIILALINAAVFYFITTHFLKKHLNLE